MLRNSAMVCVADMLLIGFMVYLFFLYFDIFLCRRKSCILLLSGSSLFIMWQIAISRAGIFPIYLNLSITIMVTFVSVTFIYTESLLKKGIFVIAFNAIWMLMETLSNNILMLYCEQYAGIQEIGSFLSKLMFMIIIIGLKKVFADDIVKMASVKYNVMFILIPMGSIYIMNNIFVLGYLQKADKAFFHSAITALILLTLNILVFYIYKKLAEDLQLKRMTSVYEQQLELCERHQQERELSTLQLRDMRHNMKNNLISILAYAENQEYEKLIRYVNELLGEEGMKLTSITNSGNIVVDSLIGYWYVASKKEGIELTAEISVPMKMPFKGADLCLILGNLLENAVEAAGNVDEEKYIRVKMKYDKGNLLLYVENNYRGKLQKNRDQTLRTTKPDAGNHGIGLPSVYRTAAKYHGAVAIEDGMLERFLVRVVLYGERK